MDADRLFAKKLSFLLIPKFTTPKSSCLMDSTPCSLQLQLQKPKLMLILEVSKYLSTVMDLFNNLSRIGLLFKHLLAA